jgi:hypothetical protein
MPVSKGAWSIVVLLIAASACRDRRAVTSPTTTPAATTFSVSGQVTDSASPKTIAGATVIIGDGPNAGRSTTTDDSGSYRLTDLQPSGFTVRVSADNYYPQDRGVTLTTNQTLSFRLNRSTSNVAPITFELTGTAFDEAGTRVPNASVYLDFEASDVPGTFYSHASGVTDGAGFYRIVFAAVPGILPHGTTAFACLRPPPGYAGDCQWVRTTTPDVSQNLRTYRINRITAGASTTVTIAPDDAVCLNNAQDTPGLEDYVCRSVRILAPTDGTITVEALSVEGGARPPLEVEVVSGNDQCCSWRLGNPTSIPVKAGAEIVANVEMLWGSTTSHSFVLNTALEQP